MPPEARDTALLWDMLEAARTIRSMTANVDLNEYLADRKLQLAVERAVEIIGEAARRVSEGFKAAHPGIPWRGIVAQRTVLAHDYGEVLQDRMWMLAIKNVPTLIEQLTPLAPTQTRT